MQTGFFSQIIATSKIWRNPRLAVRVALLGLALLALGTFSAGAEETSTVAPAPPTPAPAPPPAPVPVPFPQAVSNAANTVLTASVNAAGTAQQPIVIDPLIDGVTGAQTRATDNIQNQITSLVEQHYPQFVVKRFSTESLGVQPYVLIGTFTPINSDGKTAGTRE